MSPSTALRAGPSTALRARRTIAALAMALAVACSSEDRPTRTSAVPPPTRVSPVTETIHGVAQTDNYRWLEGAESAGTTAVPVSPEIAAWTDAQNSYTRAVLDNLPGRPEIEARLRPALETGSVTAPVVRGNRYFLARRASAQSQLVVSWREGSLGADRVLVDPAAIDPAGLTAIAWFSPSENGRLLAFGTYTPRADGATLRVIDVDTGKLAGLEIPNTPQGAQWLPDGSGFIYQQLEDPRNPATQRSRFHRLGTPPSADPILSRAPFTRLSRDGRWVVLGYPTGPASNDLWLASFAGAPKGGPLAVARGRPVSLAPKAVSVGQQGHVAGGVVDDTLFLHTTQGAPNGRVVAVSTADPNAAKWREIVRERQDAVIENVAFTRGLVAVTYRVSASNVIEVFDPTGAARGTVRLPGLGLASLTVAEDRTEAYVSFTSFNYPPTVFRIDLAQPDATPTRWASPDTTIDPASVEVERVSYASKDRTQITMFVVRKAGFSPGGHAPTLLVAHGALGTSMTPSYSASLFPWFESGGVLAIPHLRGGGEYGDGWHRAATGAKKQTAVDDLLAAADWLISNRYTNPARLALTGGGHGGLTAAAALVQQPDRFRAVVLTAPLADMLRYQRFGFGSYWVPEYGSADDPTQVTWLRAYSPYQRVTAGTKYPAVLITVPESGGPVHAMHARKLAAALQAATGSDRAQHPVLIRVDRGQGTDPLTDLVDQRVFLAWQLGMK